MTEIDRAVALLRAGELVALPTETVYGLGADAANPQAVARIFAAKGRPADHPLIVHLPAAAHVERWAREIPDIAWELAEDFWPGPLTLILKRQPGVSDAVTGGQDTVGLRVPGHPLALDLLRAFAGGVAAPSANRFGRISPTTAAHVREELGDRVAMVLDGGPCPVGIESTIVDCSRGGLRLLRPGRITPEMIAAATGLWPQPADDAAPRVPGALAAHYAPRTAVLLVSGAALLTQVQEHRAAGRRLGVLARSPLPAAAGIDPANWLTAPDDPDAYAHALYANLRRLDAMGLDLFLIESVAATAAWAAVADRLRRAAAGSGAASRPESGGS